MKSNQIKSFNQRIISKLKKGDISFDDFLNDLSKNSDRFFDNPELEFELLLSNGLPLEINADKVFLKTISTLIENQVFCIVDIETNGSHVSKGHQIIELGAVKYQNGQIIDKFDTLVYAKKIPEYIQEVTNITPKMLKKAPDIFSVLKEFKIFLEDSVFIAHDIKFDYNFISNSLKKYDLGNLENRKLCTIDLSKRTIIAERYGLKYLKEQFNINIENHHRAYSDALSTTFIFEKLLKELNPNIKYVEELIDFSKNAKILVNKNKRPENNTKNDKE